MDELIYPIHTYPMDRSGIIKYDKKSERGGMRGLSLQEVWPYYFHTSGKITSSPMKMHNNGEGHCPFYSPSSHP
jgi:hypothetical protein